MRIQLSASTADHLAYVRQHGLRNRPLWTGIHLVHPDVSPHIPTRSRTLQTTGYSNSPTPPNAEYRETAPSVINSSDLFASLETSFPDCSPCAFSGHVIDSCLCSWIVQEACLDLFLCGIINFYLNPMGRILMRSRDYRRPRLLSPRLFLDTLDVGPRSWGRRLKIRLRPRP